MAFVVKRLDARRPALRRETRGQALLRISRDPSTSVPYGTGGTDFVGLPSNLQNLVLCASR